MSPVLTPFGFGKLPSDYNVAVVNVVVKYSLNKAVIMSVVFRFLTAVKYDESGIYGLNIIHQNNSVTFLLVVA